jgi:hypothetical protein
MSWAWRWELGRDGLDGAWRLVSADDTAAAVVRWEPVGSSFEASTARLPSGARAVLTLSPESPALAAGAIHLIVSGDRRERRHLTIAERGRFTPAGLALARLEAEAFGLGAARDPRWGEPFDWTQADGGFELVDRLGRAVASTLYVPDDNLSAPGRWVAGAAGVFDDQAVTTLDRVPDCPETRTRALHEAELLARVRS